jgi:CheY-like chemotaxis protein
MPNSKTEDWDQIVSPESDIQKLPERTVVVEKALPAHLTALGPDAKVPQFRYRVLIVEDEPTIRETATQMLENVGYEVLAARDGLDGLHALSKSLPDVIISDLNMPRMSGCEFLAVVRQRFPHIATIAMSGGYSTGEIPVGVLADGFLQKGHYTIKQLSQQVAMLVAASPLRSERKKTEIARLFVPRDQGGYLKIPCPTCLRATRLQATSLNGGLHQTICQSCGMALQFEIDHEVEPLIERNGA